MKALDLNLLRVLDALFDSGSVSRAADTLGITQPGVSLALRRLREHFEDSLFVRQGGAMVPTALAESLREPVSRALETIQSEIVPARPFDPERSQRSFTINLSDLGDLVFLPDLIARIRERGPAITVRSVSADPAALLDGMARGTIDLAIGHLTDVDSGSLYEQTLFVQDFVCLVRAGHPVIGDTLTLDQFVGADHVVVSQDGRSQARFERRVRDLGIERRIVLHSPHFMSVPLLVAQSDMVTVVPRAVGHIYARLLGLRPLPLPFEVPGVPLRQFWHRRAHTEPGVQWLRRLVSECFVGHDPTQDKGSPFWSAFPNPAGAPDQSARINASSATQPSG